MTVATVASRALAGIDAPEVTVGAHLGPGLPAFQIVGLPDAEVREARDRVRAALNHAHFEFPARRITVNLAPAELPKDSSRFDLPIALGILAASGQLAVDALAGHEFAGELSLAGELRAVRGALAMALSARGAGRAFVLPAGNAPQAALADGARILPARTLLEVVAHLASEAPLAVYAEAARATPPAYADFADVKGQQQVKRALEVAAAGGHSVLMVGPPGTGKSMLAARFPGILPPLSEAAALEVAAMNPCPCGHCGDRTSRCRCTPERIARYRGRVSGPLADRIDIKLEVPAPREAELVAPVPGEASSAIRGRVAQAHETQLARQHKPNALLGTREIDRHCATNRDGDQLLRHALARLLLSARAYHRVLRVARTIADLAASSAITAEHIAEAIQYRRLDASF